MMLPFLSESWAKVFPVQVNTYESSKTEASRELELLDLFDTLWANLLRYTISLGLSVQDGEDIIQETFLALFCHLERDGSRSNLRGWLFSVTHNLALKRRASNHNRNRIYDTNYNFSAEPLDSSPTAEEELLFTERQKRLLVVLRALPENDRWCLQLRAEGFKYREISRIVGISLGSVSTSLTRSLARLSRIDER